MPRPVAREHVHEPFRDFAQVQGPRGTLEPFISCRDDLTRKEIDVKCRTRQGVSKFVGVRGDLPDMLQWARHPLSDDDARIMRKTDSPVNNLIDY